MGREEDQLSRRKTVLGVNPRKICTVYFPLFSILIGQKEKNAQIIIGFIWLYVSVLECLILKGK